MISLVYFRIMRNSGFASRVPGARSRAGSMAITATRSACDSPPQPTISWMVRPQPAQNPLGASMVQMPTQGEEGEDMRTR